MSMKNSIAALLLVAVVQASQAAWLVKTERDSMTDQIRKSVVVTNATGHSLTLYRRDDGSVWASFRLPRASADVLSNERAPIYRVDKSEAVDLDGLRSLQARGIVQGYAWEPKWINWLVWSGQGAPPLESGMQQIMSGKSVVVRYYLFTGGSKETVFAVAGGRQPITQGLDLAANAQSTSTDPRAKAVADLVHACAEKLSLKCVEAVKRCADDKVKDAEQVRACAAAETANL
jgi:hypothetical protein